MLRGQVFTIIILSLLLGVFVAACEKFQGRKNYIEGEVLVQFRPGLTEVRIAEVATSVEAFVKDKIPQQNVYVFSFSQKISPLSMVERLKKINGVLWAEPNYLHEAFLFPVQDAYAANEFLPLASPSVASTPVAVAVIDTGVNPNHPALAGRVLPGYNFHNNTTEASGSSRGVGYHGTASAGRVIAGAAGTDVKVMPLQVNDGESRFLSTSAILKAIYYAADNGAKVISMSFGSSSYSPLMQQALDYAHSKGAVLVASAGNNASSVPQYPAAYNHVIAVGATNEFGKMAGFSNFGNYVDLVAPGWGLKGLSWDGERTVNGTSFSAPFIAGVAALFKSYFPSLDPLGVEQQIKALAINVDRANPARAGQMGVGFIGADAVKKLSESILNGTFRLAVPSREPLPLPSLPTHRGPWLVIGKAGQGSYVLQPDGSLVKQES